MGALRGAGISWSRRSTDTLDSVTDIGLNLKGGLLFNRRGSAQPYAEAVLNFGDRSDPLILKVGLLFVIGG